MIEKCEEKDLYNPTWPYNLKFEMTEFEIMLEWLTKMHGHGDIYTFNGKWLCQKTEKPIDTEIRYFFWGHGRVQFRYEEDMVAFILRFSG